MYDIGGNKVKPIIAIISGLKRNKEEGVFEGELYSYITQEYVDAVEMCGGIPFLIPLQKKIEDVEKLLDVADGIILPGGNDIDPSFYHEKTRAECGEIFHEVDQLYLWAIELAEKLNKPLLAICKGHQMLNVAYGGTLYQDLHVQKENVIEHSQNQPRHLPFHEVQIKKGSILYDIFSDKTQVNSFHHQAIKDLSEDFEILAKSSDGIIEAVLKKEGNWMLGVQWHPEMMAATDEKMKAIFQLFVNRCKKR